MDECLRYSLSVLTVSTRCRGARYGKDAILLLLLFIPLLIRFTLFAITLFCPVVIAGLCRPSWRAFAIAGPTRINSVCHGHRLVRPGPIEAVGRSHYELVIYHVISRFRLWGATEATVP